MRHVVLAGVFQLFKQSLFTLVDHVLGTGLFLLLILLLQYLLRFLLLVLQVLVELLLEDLVLRVGRLLLFVFLDESGLKLMRRSCLQRDT